MPPSEFAKSDPAIRAGISAETHPPEPAAARVARRLNAHTHTHTHTHTQQEQKSLAAPSPAASTDACVRLNRSTVVAVGALVVSVVAPIVAVGAGVAEVPAGGSTIGATDGTGVVGLGVVVGLADGAATDARAAAAAAST